MAATVNLRTFPFSQQFDCPHCHHPVTVYDPSGTEFVVCINCHSYCRFIATGHLQVQQPVSPIKFTPVLALGAEGVLKDIPYKVIGYMEKKETGTEYEYEWREYMLYSYQKGYAFLAEYDGHWSLIAGKQHYPEVDTATEDGYVANMDGVDYALYNKYSPVITALTGEYDWDAYEERVSTSEYINPPFILVKEENKSNPKIIDWYLGEYIHPREIAAGFNVDISRFPHMVDIGANQPNPYKERWDQVLKLSVAALVLMIAVQLTFAILRPTQLIMNKSVDLSLPPLPKPDSTKHDTGINSANNLFTYQSNPTGNYEYQSLKTSAFTIYSGPAPVKIEINAPVDNNWLEATLELVNEKDNQTWDVTREIEYYHGYEDGESWSEGSTSESVTLPAIPPGKYHLNIYPYSGSTTMYQMDIKVTANITIWQNLIITFLLLCLYPLYCWFIQRQFEINRWMGNDYSPYKTTKSND